MIDSWRSSSSQTLGFPRRGFLVPSFFVLVFVAVASICDAQTFRR